MQDFIFHYGFVCVCAVVVLYGLLDSIALFSKESNVFAGTSKMFRPVLAQTKTWIKTKIKDFQRKRFSRRKCEKTKLVPVGRTFVSLTYYH